MVPGRAFAVTEYTGQLENPLHARGQQLFHREFGRGMEVDRPPATAGFSQRGLERGQMRLHPRRHLKRRGIDFDIAAPVEKFA